MICLRGFCVVREKMDDQRRISIILTMQRTYDFLLVLGNSPDLREGINDMNEWRQNHAGNRKYVFKSLAVQTSSANLETTQEEMLFCPTRLF